MSNLDILEHVHLLSASLAILSLAIDTLSIKPHLLSGHFAINSQLQSTILLSIIICYQIFALLSIITLTSFFLKIRKKMEKFLKIWNSSVSGKLCVGMESARFVPFFPGIYHMITCLWVFIWTTLFVFSKMIEWKFKLNIIYCIINVNPFSFYKLILFEQPYKNWFRNIN